MARARVLPGHEVGDGSDRWAPPVCDSGAQDPLVSGRREVEGCAGVEASWAAAYALGRNPGGGKELGLWRKPEGRVLLFLFSVSLFF